MDRIRQLAAFWNWLPAFRVVAETQHLPTAARELNVTAPALSRSIKLLERQLGHQLFQRVGRNIRLTERGRQFLATVRDGMRLVHEGMSEVRGTQFRGPVRILSSGMITSYLVASLRELRQRHPDLCPTIGLEAPDEAPARLLRGELDLALHSHIIKVDRLCTEHLGESTNGIYCGPGHPLYRKRKLSLKAIGEHDFVAPTAAGGHDGWPAEQPRIIRVRVLHMHVGCEVCAQGELLATLPDVVARGYGGGGVLHRLPFDLLPPTQLFATHRPTLAVPGRAEAVLQLVRKQIKRAAGR